MKKYLLSKKKWTDMSPPPLFFSRTLLYLLWQARRGSLWVWPRPGYEGSSEMKTQSQKYLKNIYRSNRRKNNSVSLHHKNIYRSNREKLLGLSILHKYLQPSHYVLSINENMGNTCPFNGKHHNFQTLWSGLLIRIYWGRGELKCSMVYLNHSPFHTYTGFTEPLVVFTNAGVQVAVRT